MIVNLSVHLCFFEFCRESVFGLFSVKKKLLNQFIEFNLAIHRLVVKVDSGCVVASELV